MYVCVNENRVMGRTSIHKKSIAYTETQKLRFWPFWKRSDVSEVDRGKTGQQAKITFTSVPHVVLQL